MSTNVTEFISELDVGEFSKKVSEALSEVAVGVMNNGEKGSVTIELNFDIHGSNQALVKSKLKYIKPTARGKQSEEDTTETIMYVSKNGALSLMPENQKQMFQRDEGVIEHQNN